MGQQASFLIFFVLGLLMVCPTLEAQDTAEEYCATTVSEADFERLKQEALSFSDASKRTAETFDRKVLAATIHIVRRSNGTGGISLEAVASELAHSNSFLRNTGVEFYIKEVNYINSDTYFNFNFNSESAMGGQNDRVNTLNIYFVNTLSLGLFGGTACGYAYLPGTGPDRMVIRNDCATNGSTLVHEIGHFLGLIHTHGPTNTINGTDELVNGSNCSTAGDLVCDTPADPLLRTTNVNTQCQYTGSSRDRNGQLFAPNVRNLMSYSRIECRDDFSQGQYQRMADAYEMHRTNIQLKPVIANFDIQSQQICAGNTVTYTHKATGANSYAWSFPGASPSSSTQPNPTVTYNSQGVFNATLTVTGANGLTDSYTIYNAVNVKPAVTNVAFVTENFSSPTSIDGKVVSENFANSFQLNPDFSLTGGRSAYIPLFGKQASPNIERLNTKVWKSNEGGEYLLQFDYAYKNYPGKEDILSIYNESYCRKEGRTLLWTARNEELSDGESSTEAFFPMADDWIQKGLFFNLPTIDNSYNLSFEVISGGGNNLFIDNYKIRKRKPLDSDSLVLIDFYHATNGALPWNLRQRVDQWAGVEIQGGRVVGLNFENMGLELTLDFSLAGLTQLTAVNFSGNNVDLRVGFLSSPSLKSLHLDSASLEQLPVNWSGLPNLEHLSLSHNKVVLLPSGIYNLPKIKTLILRNNRIVTLADTPFTSPNIELLDFGYNSLRNTPTVNTEGEDQIIDISANFQSFLSLNNIPVNRRSAYVYAPQKLIGQNTYKYPEPTATIEINCPASDALPATKVKWYKNNEEVSAFADQKTITVTGEEADRGYYQCRTTNESFPDLELQSAYTFIHWDQPSICEKGIAGTYQVTSTGELANGSGFNISKTAEIVAVKPFEYSLSDLSGGVAALSEAGIEIPVTLAYECGLIRLAVENAREYHIYRSNFDVSTGGFTIFWRNKSGDQGESVYELVEAGLSNQTEMLQFNIDIQVGPTVVDRPSRSFEVVIGCVEGSPPPTFTLSDGASAFIGEQLQVSGASIPGTQAPFVYTVVAEDGIHKTNWTVNFDETPRILSTTFTSLAQSNCFTPNGSAQIATININGEPFNLDSDIFRVEWFAESNLNDPIAETFAIEQRMSGLYYYRATERASGCRTPLTEVVIEDNTLPGEVSIEVESDDRSCTDLGQPDGSLTVHVSGTAGTFEIAWFEEGEELAFSDLPTVQNLRAGDYRVEVTDVSTGCVYHADATIASIPSVLTGSFLATPQIDCDAPDGKIELLGIVQDGVPQSLNDPRYEIQWSETSSFDAIASTGVSFDNLVSKTYFVRIIDVLLDCQSQVYTQVVGAEMLGVLNISERTNNTLCFVEEGNGAISVNVGGATEGYSFQWYNGTTTSGTPIGNSARLAGRIGGTYTAKVTSLLGDTEGCFSTITTSITNVPNILEATLSTVPVTSCVENNGSASVSNLLVNGINTFLGSNYLIEWSDRITFSNTLSTGRTINGLAPGRYFARVTEVSTGCITSTIGFNIEEDLIDISADVISSVNTNCSAPANGSLTATNVEPQSSYSFAWYKDEVLEENRIGTNQSVTGLTGGIYSLVITENVSGCTFIEAYEVVDQLIYPTLQTTFEPQTSCAAPNGIAKISSILEGSNTTSNFANYQIEWSVDANFSQIIGNTATLSNLTEGRYYLRATNRTTRCNSTISFVDVPAVLVFPEISLIRNVSEKPALEQLGTLEIGVDFDGEYTVEWFEGSEAGGEVIGESEELPELQAGKYTVKVSAALSEGGCISTATFAVLPDLRRVQEISFSLPQRRHFQDAPLLLQATSTSELPVSFEVLSGEASITDGKLIANVAGEVVIRAFSQGSNRYFPAEKTDSITIEGNFSIKMVLETESSENIGVGQAVLYNLSGQELASSTLRADTLVLNEIKRGEYFLKIRSVDRPDNFFNYYHQDQFVWGNAKRLHLQSDTTLFPMLIARKDNIAGQQGMVSGVLYNGQEESIIILNALRQGGQPMANANLILLKEGLPIGLATSDANGNFQFAGLPEGNYTVMIDIFGVEFNAAHISFEVKSTRPTKLTIYVGRNGSGVELEVVSGTPEKISGVNIFPNPVNAILTITFDSIEKVRTLDVLSTGGKRIFRREVNIGEEEVQLDLSNYNAGMYLIVITVGDTLFVERIIKR